MERPCGGTKSKILRERSPVFICKSGWHIGGPEFRREMVHESKGGLLVTEIEDPGAPRERTPSGPWTFGRETRT